MPTNNVAVGAQMKKMTWHKYRLDDSCLNSWLTIKTAEIVHY